MTALEYSHKVEAYRPTEICPACWRVWVADRLRLPLLWCWHRRVVARLRAGGQWALLEEVSPDEWSRLRAEVQVHRP